MLKDATGIRWFSSPRSRIPIINPESVKLVGISLEIADLAIVLPTIFSSCTLPSHGILPQLYVHTFIYIFIHPCYPMIIIIEIIGNNFRPTRFYIYNERVNSRLATPAHRYYYAPCVPTQYLFSLSSRIIIIEISCNLNNFNLSLEIDRRGVDAQQGIILDNKLIILGEKARFFESSPPSMYRVGNWKR